jgi:succinyl-diaminopimelate desuccinylase
MSEFDVLSFTKSLVKCVSVSPQDAGCQLLIKEQLESLGFVCEFLNFGDVTNLWARLGTEGAAVCFCRTYRCCARR